MSSVNLRGEAMDVPLSVCVESDPVFQIDLMFVPGAKLYTNMNQHMHINLPIKVYLLKISTYMSTQAPKLE